MSIMTDTSMANEQNAVKASPFVGSLGESNGFQITQETEKALQEDADLLGPITLLEAVISTPQPKASLSPPLDNFNSYCQLTEA